MAVKNNVISKYNVSTEDNITILKQYRVNGKEGNLSYLVYELEKKLNDNSVVRFYKASSFFRLNRVADSAKDNVAFMEIHTDIMRSLYKTKVNFVEIIANILNPEPIGLVFLYGVQSTGNSMEEAIRNCSADFEALLGAFIGTHRKNHIGPVDNQVMAFLQKSLNNQKYISVIKGIPQSNAGATRSQTAMKTPVKADEQLEQFLAGSDTIEFCLVLMATPINDTYLHHWLTKSLHEQSKWERQKQGTDSLNFSLSIPLSMSLSESTGTGTNRSANTSQGSSTSSSHSQGTSNSTSVSESTSNTTGGSSSESISNSQSQGTSQSTGTSETTGSSSSMGVSGSISIIPQVVQVSGSYTSGTSESIGTTTSQGTTESQSQSQSVSSGSSWSNSSSISESTSTGVSSSDSYGTGTSNSTGSSWGTSTSNSTSSAFSTGANVGFSFGKTYQWVDKEVEYICELLGEQNRRLKQMANGDGGFYVDMYIATNSYQNQSRLSSVAQTTWVNPNAQIDMLRLEIPDPATQRRLALHLQALSPCMEVVYNPKDNAGYYYKFASVLASSELAAYSHPPRISIGGLDSSTTDIPERFAVPTNRQNKEIMIGYVLAPSRYSYETALSKGNGYLTPYKYTIGNNEMHHAFISGASRSGKSVLATRAVYEMYMKGLWEDRKGNKKRKRVLILDPKGEWRKLASMIPEGKFNFYSIGKGHFHPLKMNIMRVPVGVDPNNYMSSFVDHFCSAYGLLQRAVAQITDVIYRLYEKADVFGHAEDPYWANEKSKDITLFDVYDELDKELKNSIATRNNHNAEAIQTYLTRLSAYTRKHSLESVMFCNKGGPSSDILLGEDELTVIEAFGLSDMAQRFFFTLFMDSVYQCALNNGPQGFYTNSYETVIVLEEANSFLIANGNDDAAGQASINKINTIIDKSASLGLFIWTITQKIASMPKSVIANSGIVFVGRTAQEEDFKVVNATLGFTDKLFSQELERFYPRMSVGMFIAKVSKGMDVQSQTPVLIQSEMIKAEVPSDSELDVILKQHEVARIVN